MSIEIFEKHPEADAYRVGGFYSPYCLVSKDKRFTDAELAAEYHCAEMGTWLEHFNVFKGPEEVYRKIHEAFSSFAFLPHAHETDYQ